MVAVVSGSGLGLFGSSANVLGGAGASGNSQLGRGGDRVYVNSATGNLVVQSQDEHLSALGLDIGLVRTYNSQGLLDDDNGDNWRLGIHQRVYGGTTPVNTAGATVRKVFGDGRDVLYTYDTGLARYVSTEGDGAHDTLTNSGGTWTWTDGSGRNTETYDATTGRFTASRDADGNTVSYTYTGSLLTSIVDGSGQTTYLEYISGTNNLGSIRVSSSGQDQTITRYTYDSNQRLQVVTVDLSPQDNAVSDGNTYTTTYTYDGTSRRILSITQKDGSSVAFTYENVGGAYRVKTYTDGEGRISTLTYATGGGSTSAPANTGVLSTSQTDPYTLISGSLTTPVNGSWAATVSSHDSSDDPVANPSIGMAANGNAVSIWSDGVQLFARHYTRSSNTWTSTPFTLDNLATTVSSPKLAVDRATGNAVAAWIQSDGTANSVYVARYTASSNTWSTAVALESVAQVVQTGADALAVTISGTRAAVAWLQTNGTANDLYAARFDGTSWSARELVDTRTEAAAQPAIAIDSLGNTTVAWQQSDGTANSIYQSRYTTSWSAPALVESASTVASEPRIAFDANGNGLLVWRQGDGLYARRYTSSSNTWAAAVEVDLAANTNAVSTFALALDPTSGDAVVGWVQSDGTAASVYANRFVGGAWGTATLVESVAALAATAYGSVSASIFGSNAVVAWAQRDGSIDSLYASRWSAGAWTAAVRVEERTTAASQPAVAIDGNGNISVLIRHVSGTAASIYRNRFTASAGTPYYTVPLNATWQSIANATYGVNSVEAGLALQTALGSPTLTTGAQLTGFPTTLNVVTTVPHYYTVVSGNTWASITQTIYGTSDANAIAALQSATGNPTLTTGLRLTVPLTLTYTPVGGGGSAIVRLDVQDHLGFVTSYTVDSVGRLTGILSPTVAGSRTEIRYGYDASGNLTTITEDPAGLNRITTLTYDANGNLLSTRDGVGNTVTRTYNANNQLATQTSYQVRDTDGSGPLLPTGPMTIRYIYDAENHLRFEISADGRVTEHRYAAFSSTNNRDGLRTLTFKYIGAVYTNAGFSDPAFVPTEAVLTTWAAAQTQTALERTDYAYDFRGNLSSISRWSATTSAGAGSGTASITRFVYDQRGRLLQSIDPRGEATTGDATDYRTVYTYDGLGRLLTTTQWISGSQTITTLNNQYLDTTRQTRTTFANGLVTTQTFNRTGELLSVDNGVAGSFSSLGTTSYTYDGLGRLRYVTDPTTLKQVYYLYDESGRRTAQVDADGSLTELIYDRANQLIKTVRYATAIGATSLTNLGGTTPTVTLSTLRTEASGTPSADRITRSVFDAAGQLVFTLDEAGAVTEFRYDGSGRLTDTIQYRNTVTIARTVDQVLPAAVVVTAHADDRRSRVFYNNDGMRIGTLDAEGGLVEFVYDAAGRLTSQIKYANTPAAGIRATGTFADLKTSAGTDTETTTDPERDSTTNYLYDGQGRLVGTVDGEGYLTELVYDIAGNVGEQIRYDQQVTFTAGTTVANLRGTVAAAAQRERTVYTRDGMGRITQEVRYQGSSSTTSNVTTTYSYDAVGNLLSVTRALGTPQARTTATRYDLLGRVLQELSGTGSEALAALSSPTQPQIDDIWNRYGITYTYDLNGRRTTATRRPNDAQTNVTRYFYDNDNRLRFEVNQLGERKEYRYNALNQLVDEIAYTTRLTPAEVSGLTAGLLTTTSLATLTGSVDNTKDARTTYQYALTGQVSSVRVVKNGTVAEDGLTTYAYNAFGQLDTKTEWMDATRSPQTIYIYDRRGLLVTTRNDAAGLNTTEGRTYDAFGRLRTLSDGRLNVVKRFEYDRLNRVTATTDSATTDRTVTVYDAFDRVDSTTDALNNLTDYLYDGANRRMTVTTQEGIVIVTTFNEHGQTLSVAAGGNTTTYTYDKDGQLKTVSDTLGALESRSYDRNGRLVTQTNANSVVTSFAYDAANRVLTRTVDDAVGGQLLATTYVYDGQGRVLDITEPGNKLTRMTYERDARAVTVAVDPNGLNIRTRYTYDRQDRVLTVTEGYLSSDARIIQVTEYRYDTLGRKTHEIKDPGSGTNAATGLPYLNITTQYKYDASGNLTRKIDGRNYSTWYVYNADNQLTHTVDALGGVTQTTYDLEGHVVATRRYWNSVATGSFGDIVTSVTVATHANDRVTQFVFDRDGRERFVVDALGGVIERTFDALGNVTREREYALQVASATYSTILGLQTALTTAGNSTSTVAAADRVTWFAYDVRGRRAFSVDGTGTVTQLSYDLEGNVSSSTTFATQRATTAAMDFGNLTSFATANVGNAQNRTTRYWYDTTDRLRFTLDAEGYLTESRYNDAGRQETAIVYVRKPNTIAAGANTAAVVAAVLTHAEDQSTTTLYDAAGRVSRVTDAYGQYDEYTYDAADNRRTYRNKKNSVWDYEYDAAGRLTKETAPQVAVMTVTATATSLSGTDANVRLETVFEYDQLGNLRARVEAANVVGQLRRTEYEYDALGRQNLVRFPPVRVYATSGDTQYGNVRTESALQQLTTQTAYDSLGNATRYTDVGGAVSYKAYDALGRVNFEVDALGYVTEHRYDTFGNATRLIRYNAKPVLPSFTNNHFDIGAMRTAVAAIAVAANDREIVSTYDRLGRVTQVTQPPVYAYQPNEVSGGTPFTSAAATQINEYNAFGEIKRVRRLVNPTTSLYADSYFYFDRRGLKIAQVDDESIAGGVVRRFLTTYTYDDSTGDLTKVTEYARSLPASFSPTSTTPPAAPSAGTAADTGLDRVTDIAYDRLNRKISETRTGIEFSTTAGSSTTGNSVTTYGYDALGNQTRVTLDGANTYTYYDVLGRVIGIAEPGRNRGDGTTLSPYTKMGRDAHGNLVQEIRYGMGAAAPTEAAPPTGSSNTENPNRLTTLLVDLHGHVMQSEDPVGNDRFASYDVRGKVAKEWQPVSNDGTSEVLITLYKYDVLGQQTEVTELQKFVSGQPVLATRTATYNGFGEITSKSLNGFATGETFDYDRAGRLWRTNSGDGVTKVYLYDLLGNVTAEIRPNASAAGAATNLTSYADAEAVAALTTQVMRTETRHNFVGQSMEVRHPTFSVPDMREGANPPRIETINGKPYVTFDSPYEIAMEARLRIDGSLILTRVYEFADESGYTTNFDLTGIAAGSHTYELVYMRFGDPTPVSISTGTLTIGAVTTTTLAVTAGSIGSVTASSTVVNSNNTVTFNWSTNIATANVGTFELWNGTSWVAYTVSPTTAGSFAVTIPVTAGTYTYRLTSSVNGAHAVAATGTVTMTALTTSIPTFAPWPPTQPVGTVSISRTYTAQASGSVTGWTTPGWTAGTDESGNPINIPKWDGLNSVNLSWLNAGTGSLNVTVEYVTKWGGAVRTKSFSVSGSPTGTSYSWNDDDSYLPGDGTHGAGGIDYITAISVYSGGSLIRHSSWSVNNTRIQWPVPSGYNSASISIGGTSYPVQSNGSIFYVDLENWPDGTFPYTVYQSTNGDESTATSASGSFVVSGSTVYIASQTNSAAYLPVSRSGHTLSWSATPQGGDVIAVRLYSLTNGAEIPISVSGSGSNYSASLLGLASGAYTYAVTYTRAGREVYAGRGYMEVVTTQPTASTAVSANAGALTGFADYGSNSGDLRWSPTAEAGATVVFEYKNGSTWTTLPHFAVSGGYAVDFSSFSGTIEYRVKYTRSGQSSPYLIGRGSFTINRTTTQSASVSANPAPTATTGAPRESRTFDRWGNALSMTDAANNTTFYRYNSYNQITQITQPTVNILDVAQSNGAISASTGTPISYNYYDRSGRFLGLRDANGNLNSYTLNAAGQVVTETHADTSTKQFVYNTFGETIQITDELGYKTRQKFNGNGQLARLAREVTTGMFGATTADQVPELVAAVDSNQPVVIDYEYDEAGRRKSETTSEHMYSGSTEKETIRYRYDLLGNLIRRTTPMGYVLGYYTTYDYDRQGNKIGEVNANGDTQSWAYDYFGKLTDHVDMAGTNYDYVYNTAGLLTHQQNTAGQDQDFTYDTAGHLISIQDDGVNRLTEYAYNSAGRRVRVRTTQDNVLQENTRTEYDALGRIKILSGMSFTLNYSYDRVGNRTRVAGYADSDGHVGTHNLNFEHSEYFKYDQMNRVLMIMRDTAFPVDDPAPTQVQVTIDSQYGHANGQVFTYNARGDRASALAEWRLFANGAGAPSLQYWTGTESYTYDGLGRLTETRVETVGSAQPQLIDRRRYDRAGRMTFHETRDQGSTQQSPFPIRVSTVLRTTYSTYTDEGYVVSQTTMRDGTYESTVSYEGSSSVGYDNMGNLKGYVVSSAGGQQTTHTFQYRKSDGYQQTTETAVTPFGTGSTTYHYNVNGELRAFVDSLDSFKNRAFINNAAGQTLVSANMANPLGPWTNPVGAHDRVVYTPEGEYVGSHGWMGGVYTGMYSSNYKPISKFYPGSTPTTYVVGAGDTARSVAFRVFGDGDLWYLIAQENGLAEPDTQLTEGSTLRIPNVVVPHSNDATSFRPFDLQAQLGDTSPTLPSPPIPDRDKGCGVLGIIIVIVVVVIVSIITYGSGTAPVASGLGGATTGTGTVGTVGAGGSLTVGTTTSGALVGTTTTAAATSGSTLAAVGTGAAIGAATNAATQLLSMAFGMQSQFNWKSLAAATIGGGLTAGLGSIANFGALGNFGPIAQAAANSAINQGVNIAMGLQQSFNWKSVAASALSAPAANSVGQFAGSAVGGAFNSEFIGGVARNFASGVVTQSAHVAFEGGKLNLKSIAVDAFGSAIGNSVVSSIKLNLAVSRVMKAAGITGDADTSRLAIKAMLAAGGSEADATAFAVELPALRRSDSLTDGRTADEAARLAAEFAASEPSTAGVVPEPFVVGPDGSVIPQVLVTANRVTEGESILGNTIASGVELLDQFATFQENHPALSAIAYIGLGAALGGPTKTILKRLSGEAGEAVIEQSANGFGSIVNAVVTKVATKHKWIIGLSIAGYSGDADASVIGPAAGSVASVVVETSLGAGIKEVVGRIRNLRSDLIEKIGPHSLGPFRTVKGHHPHQQAARSNNRDYNRYSALALADDGTFDHKKISAAQSRLNAEHRRTGLPYTLEVEERIQRAAMIEGGIKPEHADQILERSREELRRQGVLDPTRAPGDPAPKAPSKRRGR